jgi:hypothetical protein
VLAHDGDLARDFVAAGLEFGSVGVEVALLHRLVFPVCDERRIRDSEVQARNRDK